MSRPKGSPGRAVKKGYKVCCLFTDEQYSKLCRDADIFGLEDYEFLTKLVEIYRRPEEAGKLMAGQTLRWEFVYGKVLNIKQQEPLEDEFLEVI